MNPRPIYLATAAGLISGLSTSLFLVSLEWVANTQRSELGLLYFLPVAGLFIGGVYDRFGARATHGTELVLEETNSPEIKLPARMAPMIFFTTLLSHLFGASVGREGTAIQMGASLSDQLSPILRLGRDDRKQLLQAAVAGGFAAALGSPLGGTIFGVEIERDRKSFIGVLTCGIAAFTAYGVTLVLNVKHSGFGVVSDLPWFSTRYLIAALGLGLFIGLLMRVFITLTKLLKLMMRTISSQMATRAFIGGISIIILVALFGNRASLGLGIPEIQSALLTASPVPLAYEKLILTALSLASDFRGGEFIPLLFIGATGASALSTLFSVPSAFAAACGMASSFGSAARVPLALSVFAAGQFGASFFLYALAANAAAWLTAGSESIFGAVKSKP